ncbi:Calnexin independence factor Cif1 [Schizosaccharomyces pombe]
MSEEIITESIVKNFGSAETSVGEKQPKRKRSEVRAEKLKARKLQKAAEIVQKQKENRKILKDVSLKRLSKSLDRSLPSENTIDQISFNHAMSEEDASGYQIGDKHKNLLLYKLSSSSGSVFTENLYSTIQEFLSAQKVDTADSKNTYVFGSTFDKKSHALVKTSDSVRSLKYGSFVKACAPLFRFASGIIKAHAPHFHQALLKLELAPSALRFGVFPNFSLQSVSNGYMSMESNFSSIKYGFVVIIIVGELNDVELKIPAISHSLKLKDGSILVLRSSLLHQWYSLPKQSILYEIRLFAMSSLWHYEKNKSIKIAKKDDI